MSYRITTYKKAFEEVLGMEFDENLQTFVKLLEFEGHTEKSISYSVWKSQEKLLKFKHDSRFMGVLKNEILKYSWPKGDPRWDGYWKKKNEEEKTKKISEELRQKQIAENRKLGAEKAKETKYKKRYKGFVYFIQGEYGGAIKIGFSKKPEERLKQLQTGYPDTLQILLLIAGNEKDEKRFHDEFESYRLNGEWFKPDKFILDKINELKIKHNQI
ncbi:GIY-YIG nuclease family protein [Tissierella pigra]|uniref:GIY-YIG nuclease family protein n=1 Tax=Tissierella pigra TaxID=2607614 RepID=A0A6N7XIU3_9FIRM|nr:GIY-YIG nuclease family protein [Tissierella pigra]MSU01959.1 GIY-YIG nuclease family protein [Tissierella pigra]